MRTLSSLLFFVLSGGTLPALILCAVTNQGTTPRQYGILVIDDDEAILFTAKTLLESVGYPVHVAASPQEGIDFYRQHWRTIALVVVDFLMPAMTGDEVVECLRHLNPDVKILVCAGWDDNVAIRLSASNLQGFVEKPFSLENFVRRVREAIQSPEQSQRLVNGK